MEGRRRLWRCAAEPPAERARRSRAAEARSRQPPSVSPRSPPESSGGAEAAGPPARPPRSLPGAPAETPPGLQSNEHLFDSAHSATGRTLPLSKATAEGPINVVKRSIVLI